MNILLNIIRAVATATDADAECQTEKKPSRSQKVSTTPICLLHMATQVQTRVCDAAVQTDVATLNDSDEESSSPTERLSYCCDSDYSPIPSPMSSTVDLDEDSRDNFPTSVASGPNVSLAYKEKTA